MKLVRISSLILSIFLSSCGKEVETKGESQSSPTETKAEPKAATAITFRGFVAKAFELEVDGLTYTDMEDFYTQELSRLPAKVKEAGYGDDYAVRFEAELGLQDLWYGMAVYISTASATGYLGETVVQNDGQFLVELPQDAVNDTYRVRANKRINVVLTKGTEQIRNCYNFSAIDLSVPLKESSKPIILNKFSTSLTKYECERTNSNGGLSIPKNPVQAKVKVGSTKNEVLSILGADRLVVEGDGKWCFFSKTTEAHPNCALNIPSSCQCAVLFEEDVVTGQENINSNLLDLSTF